MTFHDVFGRIESALDDDGLQSQLAFSAFFQLFFHQIPAVVVLRSGNQLKQEGCSDDKKQLALLPDKEGKTKFFRLTHHVFDLIEEWDDINCKYSNF